MPTARPTDDETTATGSTPVPRGRDDGHLREALLAWVATVVVIAVLAALGRLSSLVADNAQALAALLFVYLPLWLLRRRGTEPSERGIDLQRPWRRLGTALATAAVVFPLFALGHHVYRTRWEHRTLRLDEHVLVRWPLELAGRPALPPAWPVAIWDERGMLHLWHERAPEGGRWSILLAFDAPVRAVWATFLRQGHLWRRPVPAGQATGAVRFRDRRVSIVARGRGGVRIDTTGTHTVTVEVRRNGTLVEAHGIRLGRWGASGGDNPARWTRSWTTMLWLLLVHLVVVGFPEETFYRGYVQTEADRRWRPRWRVLGAQVGPGLIFTSLLFALGHFLVEFDPSRLVVFFPSLLFGWLRNRTDSVLAPAILHGLSNGLLEVLTRCYA